MTTSQVLNNRVCIFLSSNTTANNMRKEIFETTLWKKIVKIFISDVKHAVHQSELESSSFSMIKKLETNPEGNTQRNVWNNLVKINRKKVQ